MRGYEELTLLILCVLAYSVNASHYRGGTIYWSAVDDNPEQVKITYRLGFKLNHVEPGHDDCLENSKESGELLQTNGYLKCDQCNNGEDQEIQDLEYVCTDYNEIGEWAIGLNTLVYDAPSTSFNISYESCCWVNLVSHERGTGRGWKLAAAIDLRRRPDTGRINSSPISETLPVQFMEKGCSYALQIPVIDPDNDDVRCRWPDMENECNQANNGACGPTPKAKLKTNDCTLRFDTKKMEVGWHAVNLIIEDFVNEESDVPLSKVSLQFLISVLDSSECNKPRVISPSTGACRTIAAESKLLLPLVVDVAPGRRVSTFTTLKPEGMTQSEIRPIRSAITEFYTLLTWTPTVQQIGKHTICFQATDNYRSPSAMTCMHLNVMDADSVRTLTAEPDLSTPVDGIRLRFRFSGEIQRPSDRKFIIIRDYHGVEHFRIDASKKKSDVTYDGRILEFGFPPILLSKIDSGYKLIFEAGLAKGATKCGAESEPYEWNLQQIVLAAGIRRKSPGRYIRPPAAFPQCFASSMTIYVVRKIVGDIDPYRMHLIDPSCRGERHNDTHYVIGTGYGMCGTTFQRGEETNKDDTNNIMGNIIYIPAAPYTNNSIVTRDSNIEIHVNCTIASEYLTRAEFDTEVKTLIYYESGYGHFNFSLKMYKNDVFNKYFKHHDFPVDVNLKQRLYFEARSWARAGTQLLLDSCRATPTANPFDAIQYNFIQDGCAIDDTVEMHPIRFPLRKRFSISAFAFMGHLMENSVFVHCDMRICDMLDPHSRCARTCVPLASRRERRDVILSDGNSSAAYQDSDGPIRLVQLYEFNENDSVFNVNADLVQTVMISVVILLLVVLIIVHLRGITCRRINQDKGKDFI